MANTQSDGEKRTSEADDDLRTKIPISINLDHATDTPRNVPLDQPIIALTESQRLQTAQRMNILRSPSRESVGTDISLFSVSTLASELTNRTKFLSLKTPGRNATLSRGSSPNFDIKQQKRPDNIPEFWFEDSHDMIKSMAALSLIAGLSKSFSTSDITDLPPNLIGGDEDNTTSSEWAIDGSVCYPTAATNLTKRNAVSELAIGSSRNCNYQLLMNVKLDNASRSCSTWVAVGDMSTTSQLPSPHGVSSGMPSTTTLSRPTSGPSFSPADLIRSVNKKVRQHYIQRRLLNTYKALERLSQSEFNLDKLEMEATGSGQTAIDSGNNGMKGNTTAERAITTTPLPKASVPNRLSVPGAVSSNVGGRRRKGTFICGSDDRVSARDVDRDRGQPLTKYDRNMMIFNWLLTQESADNSSNVNVAVDSGSPHP